MEKNWYLNPSKEFFSPYFCSYNFEAYFLQENLPENGHKLTFEARHIPLSVGIAEKVPSFEKGRHLVTNGSKDELIQILDYLEKKLDDAHQLIKNKFKYIFGALITSHTLRIETLTKEFES